MLVAAPIAARYPTYLGSITGADTAIIATVRDILSLLWEYSPLTRMFVHKFRVEDTRWVARKLTVTL